MDIPQRLLLLNKAVPYLGSRLFKVAFILATAQHPLPLEELAARSSYGEHPLSRLMPELERRGIAEQTAEGTWRFSDTVLLAKIRGIWQAERARNEEALQKRSAPAVPR